MVHVACGGRGGFAQRLSLGHGQMLGSIARGSEVPGRALPRLLSLRLWNVSTRMHLAGSERPRSPCSLQSRNHSPWPLKVETRKYSLDAIGTTTRSMISFPSQQPKRPLDAVKCVCLWRPINDEIPHLTTEIQTNPLLLHACVVPM
jgi:hypothetical protein